MKHYDWKAQLKNQKLMLEEKEYQVLMLSVYGSQNYNLAEHSDSYQSDFDTKAVVLPSLDDLVKGNMVSEVLDTEVGQCEVKDIRAFLQTLVKGNPAYLEVVVSDYKLVNKDFKHLWTWNDENFEEFFRVIYPSFAKACYGMALQKEKALTHPYPSVADKVAKYGYDGKQAHHVLRLHDLFRKTKNGLTFKEAMKYAEGNEKEALMAVKTHNPNLEVAQAEKLVRFYVSDLKTAVDAELVGDWWVDEKVMNKVRNMGYEVVKEGVRNEVGFMRVSCPVHKGDDV